MASTQYHQQYWQQYKRQKCRLTITLSPAEYRALLARAATHPGRSPGQQLRLEAAAYRQQRYLPAGEILQRLEQIALSTRKLFKAIEKIENFQSYFIYIKEIYLLKQNIVTLNQRISHLLQPPDDCQKPAPQNPGQL